MKLIGDDTIIDSCIKNITHINSNLKCKAMLLNKAKTKLNTERGTNSNKNNSEDKELEDINNKYISYSIKLNI